MAQPKRYTRHSEQAKATNFTGKPQFDGTPRTSHEVFNSKANIDWRALSILRRLKHNISLKNPVHGECAEIELTTDLRYVPRIVKIIMGTFRRSPYLKKFHLELKWVDARKSTVAYVTNLGSSDTPTSPKMRKARSKRGANYI